MQPTIPQPQQRSTRGPALMIIGIVLVLVLGGGGFLAGKLVTNAQDSNKITQLNAKIADLEKQNAAQPVIAKKTGLFLNIKEWNIRLPMEKNFSDLAYRLDQKTGTQIVSITSPTLAKIGTCPNYGGEVGTITRAKAGTAPTPGSQVVGFDGNIYMLTLNATGCTSDPDKTETPYHNSVLNEFASLEAIPLDVVN